LLNISPFSSLAFIFDAIIFFRYDIAIFMIFSSGLLSLMILAIFASIIDATPFHFHFGFH